MTPHENKLLSEVIFSPIKKKFEVPYHALLISVRWMNC